MRDAVLPFRRYARFSGRSRRREYWLFSLLIVVAGIALTMLDTALGLGGSMQSQTSASPAEGYSVSFNFQGGILTVLWMLATILPGLAVSVRRLHDTGRSGWWLLILFVPLAGQIAWLVFMCLDGTRGPNRFGPDPKTYTLS